MIDKSVWMEILKQTSQNQAKGDDLYLDNLTNKFSETQLQYNIDYLLDHALITKQANLDDSFGYAKLTTKGYDFLEANGGLTCEVNEKLNTIFIKIDEAQFKALLIARIEQSELPKSQKELIITEINNLPSALITHLATTLLDAGLENLPNALQSIGIGF